MPLCSATHFPVRRCNGSRTAHASTAPIVPLSPSRRKKLSIAVSHRMPLCLRTMAQAHSCLLSAVFCSQEQSEQICSPAGPYTRPASCAALLSTANLIGNMNAGREFLFLCTFHLDE